MIGIQLTTASAGHDPAPADKSAGYSGTPLPRKLGIKVGSRVVLVDAPPAFDEALAPLPATAAVVRCALLDVHGPADVILYFVTSHSDLARGFAVLAAALASNGGLWVAWPKKASGVPTDLVEDAVRAIGLAAGLVDNKICAVDHVWSGLRFVIRIADRPART